MSMLKPRRSRRVEPLIDSDYDHEINLLDHSPALSRQSSPEVERHGVSTPGPSSSEAGPSSPASARRALRPDRTPSGAGEGSGSNGSGHAQQPEVPALELEQPTPIDHDNRTPSKKPPKPRHENHPESAIDILYENERGAFLCGIPLFASKALGNLDPPPWTNFAHLPSPTDITTAQPPDPSWEWAWPDWKINHDDNTDEDGWEYSFAFHSKFSWHGPTWWNSFVRRRAWIRKRVRKDEGYVQEDPSMLTAEYFAIRPASTISIRAEDSRRQSRASVASSDAQTAAAGIEEVAWPDIRDTESLLRALRASRIDREKVEAIESYLEHAGDDFARLEAEMHEIMSLFEFQASRRLLLSHLAQVHDQTLKSIDEGDDSEQQREKARHLTAAIKHADEEVRRLEYWSDIKEMVVEGDTKGAMDHCEGWDERWRGLDTSGPAEPAAPGESPLGKGND